MILWKGGSRGWAGEAAECSEGSCLAPCSLISQDISLPVSSRPEAAFSFWFIVQFRVELHCACHFIPEGIWLHAIIFWPGLSTLIWSLHYPTDRTAESCWQGLRGSVASTSYLITLYKYCPSRTWLLHFIQRLNRLCWIVHANVLKDATVVPSLREERHDILIVILPASFTNSVIPVLHNVWHATVLTSPKVLLLCFFYKQINASNKNGVRPCGHPLSFYENVLSILVEIQTLDTRFRLPLQTGGSGPCLVKVQPLAFTLFIPGFPKLELNHVKNL